MTSYKKGEGVNDFVTVCLPFLQYSLLIELCNQLALGVFQILKALILTRAIKIHTLKL